MEIKNKTPETTTQKKLTVENYKCEGCKKFEGCDSPAKTEWIEWKKKKEEEAKLKAEEEKDKAEGRKLANSCSIWWRLITWFIYAYVLAAAGHQWNFSYEVVRPNLPLSFLVTGIGCWLWFLITKTRGFAESFVSGGIAGFCAIMPTFIMYIIWALTAVMTPFAWYLDDFKDLWGDRTWTQRMSESLVAIVPMLVVSCECAYIYKRGYLMALYGLLMEFVFMGWMIPCSFMHEVYNQSDNFIAWILWTLCLTVIPITGALVSFNLIPIVFNYAASNLTLKEVVEHVRNIDPDSDWSLFKGWEYIICAIAFIFSVLGSTESGRGRRRY